jgi:hypothetical protein
MTTIRRLFGCVLLMIGTVLVWTACHSATHVYGPIFWHWRGR